MPKVPVGQHSFTHNETRVIAFGGGIGAGKDTAAEMALQILRTNFVAAEQWSFAGELKRIAYEVFGWDHQKDERGRVLLQRLGTEVGREYNPNIWINKLIAAYERAEGPNHFTRTNDTVVIISDARFQNEVDFANRYGISVLLDGRSGKVNGIVGHASEALHEVSGWSFTVDNSGSLGRLYDQVLAILQNAKFIKGATS